MVAKTLWLVSRLLYEEKTVCPKVAIWLRDQENERIKRIQNWVRKANSDGLYALPTHID
jgi:hypothetical protein